MSAIDYDVFPVTPGAGDGLLVARVAAGQGVPVYGMAELPLIAVSAPLANSQFSVAGTSVSLSTHLPADATHALIRITGADIRVWDDGKTPTTAEGFPLDADTQEAFWVRAPALFRMCRLGATGTATIFAMYYKTLTPAA